MSVDPGSGDGWLRCDRGHRHWGRYGGAGLLLQASLEADAEVLLQLRAGWSHHGGTWGLPGGARDRDEDAVAAARREAAEEIGLDPAAWRPERVSVEDHGGWSYATVLGSLVGPAVVNADGVESDAVAWVPAAEVAERELHPGFAAAWPALKALPPAPVLVVDVANVMGSRPDGWWKDRAGAAIRLRDALAAAPGLDLGDGLVFPELVLVTEGATRRVPAVPGVTVEAAPGSGDDTIMEVAARYASGLRPVVVVTADRELRNRVAAVGAQTLGPRTLLDAF